MIVFSPYEANDEEWLKPFATIIEDETSPDLADSCHMQMIYYDEKFEDLGPHIYDSSMIFPSCLSRIKKACYTKDSFVDIQHMMSPGYHSQLCSSRNEEEVVQPTLPYIGNPLMIHINKIDEVRWKCMIFIPQFRNI